MILEYPGVVGSGEIYLDVMKAICGNTTGKSMADLMCHHAPYTPLLGFEHRIYVDIQDRGLDHKSEEKYFLISDVFRFLDKCSDSSFDVMICSDGIEHLEKLHGYDLLLSMKLKARKSIIFTPLGDLNVTDDNHPDSHKCGWEPSHMPTDYAKIVFPNFHHTLNAGAFFAWTCAGIRQDFERVKLELNNKKWAK
jgi:hypothetical protein